MHHLVVSHADLTAVDESLDAVAGYLADVLYAATVVFLLRISLTQGDSHGMGGETLHMGGKMEEFLRVHLFGMDGLNGKGFPFVSVPVLSKTMVAAFASVSI